MHHFDQSSSWTPPSPQLNNSQMPTLCPTMPSSNMLFIDNVHQMPTVDVSQYPSNIIQQTTNSGLVNTLGMSVYNSGYILSGNNTDPQDLSTLRLQSDSDALYPTDISQPASSVSSDSSPFNSSLYAFPPSTSSGLSQASASMNGQHASPASQPDETTASLPNSPSSPRTSPRIPGRRSSVILRASSPSNISKPARKGHRRIWNHALEKYLFTPDEIATLGAPHRRTIYLASLEAHIDRLHMQLIEVGLYPIPMEALHPFKGLNCKTAKGMVAGLQHDVSNLHMRILELERTVAKSGCPSNAGRPIVPRKFSLDSNMPPPEIN